MRNVLRLTGAVAAAVLVVGSAVAFSAGRNAGRSVASNPRHGVVLVRTNLAYEGGAGAGTGIVISAGEVLTNNHVIRGATSIRVTDPASHRSYKATVFGYSVSRDIALLRPSNTQGLSTASIGSSSGLDVGNSVTAVGNADGTGVLTVSTGRLTGLHRSITVSDGQGSSARLTDLIATSARLVPGDSGGPLLSHGRVIGVDAATSGGFDFQGGEGYAIPIDTAIAVVRQIESGHGSSTVHIGATAFLGVSLGQSDAYGQPSGAVVEAVVPGAPAAKAGLVPGDVITRFGGHKVSSPDGLRKLVLQLSPGASARLSWVDEAGYAHSATVRVASGPPQ